MKDRKDRPPDIERDRSTSEGGPIRKNHGRPLPPIATRWKKGKSGNPKGRPKKQDTISMLVRRTMGQSCESDVERRTFGHLLVKSLLHAALKGDARACKLVWERHDGKLPPPDPNAGKITWDNMTRQERENWSKRAVKMFNAVYGLDEREPATALADTPPSLLESGDSRGSNDGRD